MEGFVCLEQGKAEDKVLHFNPIRHLASLHSVKISGYCVNVCVARVAESCVLTSFILNRSIKKGIDSIDVQ